MRRDKVSAALEALAPSLLEGPGPAAAFVHQKRLARSQWASAESLATHQLTRLKALVRFASRHAPYYREHIPVDHIENVITLKEALERLPILPRDVLRDHGEDLRSASLPKGHVVAAEKSSSGSTGMVVRAAVTNVSLQWQSTLGLRSHLWGGRDLRRSIAVIRRMERGKGEFPGIRARRWGPVRSIPFPTGPAFQLTATSSVEQQWDWLVSHNPAYLLTVPSILRRFAERDNVAPLGNLLGVSTIGEVVDPQLRTLVRERFGVAIHDMYSSEEAGCMAIQCPDEDFYHVQAEAMILEILDEAGRPCAPGASGRVVITPLGNFATPLIRYDIGDYAEASGPCPCGRGLPALKRLMGRRRNLMVTPDGRHFWPSVQARSLQKIIKFRAYQFRQVAPDAIEVWLAAESAVTPEQEGAMRDVLLGALPCPYRLSFHYVDEFPVHPGGKHEEFVSLLTTPEPPRL